MNGISARRLRALELHRCERLSRRLIEVCRRIRTDMTPDEMLDSLEKLAIMTPEGLYEHLRELSLQGLNKARQMAQPPGRPCLDVLAPPAAKVGVPGSLVARPAGDIGKSEVTPDQAPPLTPPETNGADEPSDEELQALESTVADLKARLARIAS